MLRTPSHLTRACGQSHYKKFWLMQTQTDSQDNCILPSPSVLSFPAANLKGSDGKVGGNTTSMSFTTDVAPQGRAVRPTVGSSDAGFGGISNAHWSNVSLSTCAESLTLQLPDASSVSFRLPAASRPSTEEMDVSECSPEVAEPRGRSGLCASFSPCGSSSPNMFSFDESTSREIGLSESAIPFVGTISVKNPADAKLSSSTRRDHDLFSVSVRGASDENSCSSGSDFFIRGDSLSQASAQNFSEVNCQIKFHGDVANEGGSQPDFAEQHEECAVNPPLLFAGRNVLRMCKLCGTTKTPLWRSGPHGPKSLCNACGIRFKKLKRSQAAGECSQVEGTHPTTPSATKFLARPLKRMTPVEKEKEAMKGKSRRRFERSKWPALMVVRRNSIQKVEDTESCLTSPGAPSPREQILPQFSSALLEWKESAAKLEFLEEHSGSTSAFAADVKEAAILLMALSCGLVLA